tara:strand:+ start:196 stop:438 length:243 start_codon:yes stop_codon:yes gene_type:complete
MKLILIIFIFAVFYLGCKKYFKKNLKNRKNYKFNRKNLYKWMNLSKKERYNLSKIDSNSYLNRRKDLLDQIRKEYKTLKK